MTTEESCVDGEDAFSSREQNAADVPHAKAFDDFPEETHSKISALYEKYKIQCTEVDRLEKQNSEYREQLLKTIREREAVEELLRNVISEKNEKFDELERKLLEYEYQLKACKDRAAAQEGHNSRYLKETTAKMNSAIAQLTKKAELAEKEKNDAVIRYATREAELMRLQSQNEKCIQNINALKAERDALKESTEFRQVLDLKRKLDECEQELSAERRLLSEKDEELRMALKRIEAGQTAIGELRTSLEQVQKQLSRESEEKAAIKEDHRKLIQQLHSIEQLKNEEAEAMKKHKNDKEELYKSVVEEMARLREQNSALSSRIECLSVENANLSAERKEFAEQVEAVKAKHNVDLEKLRSLEDIQSQVNSSLRRAEEAERSAREANAEKEQAESEATECRQHAERMLNITEQLTEKNSALSSECETLRAKNFESNSKLIEVEADLNRARNRLEELEKEVELVKVTSSAEIESLKSELNIKIVKVQELNRQVDELRNEKEVLRRKNASSVKELRAELQSLRKVNAGCHDALFVEATETFSGAPTNGGSESSRASSISSNDCAARRTANSPPPIDECPNTVQQQMVEKIVKLQRQLARKQDKIEFLEEHARHCTQELRKKTKIIQNYALREEASLLLPASDSLDQVPLSRRSGGSSLMGSIFTNGDKKSELELATEVNSRLQAVLEDTLHKNITLKNNLDTLGEEIARLSRENRQLALAKIA